MWRRPVLGRRVVGVLGVHVGRGEGPLGRGTAAVEAGGGRGSRRRGGRVSVWLLVLLWHGEVLRLRLAGLVVVVHVVGGGRGRQRRGRQLGLSRQLLGMLLSVLHGGLNWLPFGDKRVTLSLLASYYQEGQCCASVGPRSPERDQIETASLWRPSPRSGPGF